MDVLPFAPADFDALMAWFPTEADLIRWGGPDLVFPLDRRQLAAMLGETEGEPPSRLGWTARRAGTVAAHAQAAFDWRHGVARLGRVALAPEMRGRGLAVPFLGAIVERIFVLPPVERLELNVYTSNEAALATYRRLGFRQEGTRRSSVRVGGERWDTAIFAILRQERPTGRVNNF